MHTEILNIVYNAIDEQNSLVPKSCILERNVNTILCGRESRLDSLGLANVLLSVESSFNSKFGLNVCLVDEALVRKDFDSFNTVSKLVAFLHQLMSKK